MGADWSSTITISIVLAASPPARASFTTALLIVDKATNTLNGSRITSYASAPEVAAALAAGYISAGIAGWLTDAFSQVPTPAKIKVANHNTAGSETLTACLTAIETLDRDWYGTALYTRVAADVLEWAALIEARKKLFVTQSLDSSWLDSGVPSALSAIAAYERTAVIFHDTVTEAADLCWLVSRLVFDPDVQSAPWDGEVRGVAALATPLTTAQRDFLVANSGNAGLPFSSADFYVDPGINQHDRPIYEIVTGDWFAARVAEDLAALKLQFTARGEKIVVDRTGQALVQGILGVRLQQGEQAHHFAKGQTRVTPYDITSDDISNRKLRFKVEGQSAADARLFDVNVYLQQTPLQVG